MPEGQIERLTSTVSRLEVAYETARADLERQFPGAAPEEIRDPNGRYVLLDALTALVQAQAVLGAL
jgi:hypothetical protein